jgi:hypothetical protein
MTDVGHHNAYVALLLDGYLLNITKSGMNFFFQSNSGRKKALIHAFFSNGFS